MLNQTQVANANWYVYRHIRKDINQPFYIGIVCKKNYGRAIEKGIKRNLHWNRITSKTDYYVQIVFDNLTKFQASNKETEFIKLYGRLNKVSYGVLCNMTDGGDGIWGCERTNETKLKLSQQKIGCKNPSFGKKQSDDTKQRKNKGLSDSWIKKTITEKTEILKKRRDAIVLKQAKPIYVYSYTTGELLSEHDSIMSACRSLDIVRYNGKVSNVCKGKRNRVGNFTFKYK